MTQKGTVRYQRYLLPNILNRRECPWNGDPTIFTIYQFLLARANWAPGKTCIAQGVKLKRGQCVVGIRDLACRWGLSRGKVERAIIFLKKTRKIETETEPLGTLVTICDYNEITGSSGKLEPPSEPHPSHTRATPEPHPSQSEVGKHGKQKNKKEGPQTPGGSSFSSLAQATAKALQHREPKEPRK